MEAFMSIAGIILFFVIGCLSGILLGVLATVRLLKVQYPQTWRVFLSESEDPK